MATEHLLAQHTTVKPGIGKKGLGHRGEQGHQRRGVLLFLWLGRELGQIQLLAHITGKGPAPFGHGLDAEQHAPHIGMHDNRVGDFVSCHRPGGGATLQAFAGVAACILIGGLGAADTLDTDRQTFVIHHGKHRGQAFIGLTNQPAPGTVKIDHAGGRGLDPHLVLDGAAVHGIVLAERAIVIDQHLGHQEQ